MDQIPIKTPNPKCRLFLKLTSKGTCMAASVYLSEAPDPPPPRYTLYESGLNTCTPCTYSHREGDGGGGG
jgi:hypothetical protein